MTIKLQGSKIVELLIAVVLGMTLSLPAGASENPPSASALIDQPVFNSQKQEIGELEDLVIKRNGSVKKALISVGGILELGEKLVSARYRSLQFTGGQIILDVTQKQLDEQSEFNYRDHGLFTTYHYRLYPYGMRPGPNVPRDMPPGYHKRWQDEANRIPRGAPQGYADENQKDDQPFFRQYGSQMRGMRGWYSSWNWAYYPARMLASVVLGQAVINKQGEEVATVEDLIISTAGKVERLILSYGGFLDIDDRRVAVPYRPVGFTNRGITYDITARELENLPKFSAAK